MKHFTSLNTIQRLQVVSIRALLKFYGDDQEKTYSTRLNKIKKIYLIFGKTWFVFYWKNQN